MAVTEVVLEWEGILTAIVLSIGLVIMAFDKLSPEYTFLAMTTVLLLAGVLNIKDALGGYANSGLHTVMLLFVVAAGIEKTGGACVGVRISACFLWLRADPGLTRT